MKFVALYRRPEDPATFDAAYAEHLKLADAVPHTLGYTVTRSIARWPASRFTLMLRCALPTGPR